MRIGITGASGFIGRHLTAFLKECGHQIIPLGRGLLREDSFQQLVETLEDCDALVNLAGASINHRWTQKYKSELCDSRVGVTSRLVCALKSTQRKPEVMISTSAVGYYPSEGEYDERDVVIAEGFLASLCRDWEAEALKCPSDIRLVITRLGVVLALDGGAMQQMATPVVRTKFSAVLGSGKQAFPWVAIQDVCRAIVFLIEHKEAKGVYNLVSPQQITQKQLALVLAKAYRAWGTLPVPGVVFRCLFGERATALLQGQKVHPSRLLEAGFEFSVPTVEQLLNKQDTHTVSSLDVTRYMGLWYEIARYENSFERDMTGVTATYTLLPDGKIQVENVGYRNGVKKRAVGHAFLPDAVQPGKLKVSFFLWFYSDYYVLELDSDNYSYALVGSSSDKYLWILSRTPSLKKETKDKLIASIKNRGYDVEKLVFLSDK